MSLAHNVCLQTGCRLAKYEWFIQNKAGEARRRWKESGRRSPGPDLSRCRIDFSSGNRRLPPRLQEHPSYPQRPGRRQRIGKDDETESERDEGVQAREGLPACQVPQRSALQSQSNPEEDSRADEEAPHADPEPDEAPRQRPSGEIGPLGVPEAQEGARHEDQGQLLLEGQDPGEEGHLESHYRGYTREHGGECQ